MYYIRDLYCIISKENVTFHGYRQALPKLRLVSFDRDEREIKELEEHLYKITGVAIQDNHTVFEVKVDEYVLALQFTDRDMWLGLGVEQQPW